jgi:hypothetical protein
VQVHRGGSVRRAFYRVFKLTLATAALADRQTISPRSTSPIHCATGNTARRFADLPAGARLRESGGTRRHGLRRSCVLLRLSWRDCQYDILLSLRHYALSKKR